MLRIPFEGPTLEGRRALVHTKAGVLRGIVMTLANDGLDLAVDGTVKHVPASDVRAIAPA